MIERSDLIRHVNRGRMDRNFPHVVVPLLGRFKEETGKRSHLLIMTNTTKSGIAIMSWVERMVGWLERKGLTEVAPAICDSKGGLLLSYLVDGELKD